MKYMLMPLEQHFDKGLGATGMTFEKSANILYKDTYSQDNRLPICFLYRHAIELYLKSAIVVIHRSLELEYGDFDYNGTAHILEKGKWIPIYRVHSIASLWNYLLKLICDSKIELEKRCNTDWQEIPEDLISSIEKIEQIDGASTFFRYPDDRRPDIEQIKSTWKSKNVDEVKLGVPPEAKPVKLFLLLDQKDQISEAFEYDGESLKDVVTLLKNTAETLSGLYVGLRVELAGGL